MEQVVEICDNSQELEEGEINDDGVTEASDDLDKSSEFRPNSLISKGCSPEKSNQNVFGKVDIDLRNVGDHRSSPIPTRKRTRHKQNFNFSYNSANGGSSQRNNARRTRKLQTNKFHKFQNHRSAPSFAPRVTKVSQSRTETRYNSGGGKHNFHSRAACNFNRQQSKPPVQSKARKAHSTNNTPKTDSKYFSNVTRRNSYPPKMSPSLTNIGKEDSYEFLLDQYRLIKLELGKLKKEEAKRIERESDKGRSESRHATPSGKSGGNDKENKHQSRRYSRSPSKGKSKATRGDSVLLDIQLKAATPCQDLQEIELPRPPCEEEEDEDEDELELRRVALASRNPEMNAAKEVLQNGTEFSDSYPGPKRRVSRENSNQKITSSNLDNYDSVDMDLDSDCNAQATDLSEVEMDTSDENEANEVEAGEDDDEVLLREQLLRSLERRRNLTEAPKEGCNDLVEHSTSPIQNTVVSEVPKEARIPESTELQGSIAEIPCSTFSHNPTVPPLPSLVINLAEDSSSEESEADQSEAGSSLKGNILDGLDCLLREARRKTEVAPQAASTTPAAVSKLSKAQQLEYRKLKAEIAKRELNQPKSQTAQAVIDEPNSNNAEARGKKKSELNDFELKLKSERLCLVKARERLTMLQQLFGRRKRLVDVAAKRLEKLREEMAMVEESIAKNQSHLDKISHMVAGTRNAVSKHMLAIPKLERECSKVGQSLHGALYQLPPGAGIRPHPAKRRISQSSTTAGMKKAKTTDGASGAGVTERQVHTGMSSAELLAEKSRLQRLEQDIAHRLEELRSRSTAGSPKPQVPKQLDANSVKVSTLATTSSHKSKAPARASPCMDEDVVSGPPAAQSPSVKVAKEDDIPPLTSVFEIQDQEQDGSTRRGWSCDVVHVEDKVTSRMLVTETACLPIKPYSTNCPVATTSFRNRKLTFCPSLGKTAVSQEKGKVFSGFQNYSSYLLHLSSYRLNPRFVSESGQSLSSNSFTNKVDSRIQLCKFDLTGTCNDDQCKWQHSKQYTCSPVDVVVDLVSFCPESAKVLFSDDNSKSEEKMYHYGTELLKQGGADLDAVTDKVAQQVRSRLHIKSPHFAQFFKRRRKPRPVFQNEIEDPVKVLKGNVLGRPVHSLEEDSFVDPEKDVRYFQPQKGLNGLEEFLKDNPTETLLWLKLASYHLNSSNGKLESLNRALDVLSRALEVNCDDVELWQHYLSLFSGHPDSKDILSLCQQALEFTKQYPIWWKYLELSVGFQSKSQVCRDLLVFLQSDEGGLLNPDPSDLSHRLLETFLYLVQLHIETGKTQTALDLFGAMLSPDLEVCVEVSSEWSFLASILPELSGPDHVLSWLAYFHLLLYQALPSCLFVGGTNQPSKLAHKEQFLLAIPDVSQIEASLVFLLRQAIVACDKTATPQQCWPLHLALIQIHLHMERRDLAVAKCRGLCRSYPDLLEAWMLLAHLHLTNDLQEEAEQVFHDALQAIPLCGQLCNTLALLHFNNNKLTSAKLILRRSISAYFQPTQAESTAILYKLILNHHYGEDIPLLVPERMDDMDLSERDTTYIWLNYALYLQCSQADTASIVDVFESALVAVKQQENQELIWWRYLEYTLSCDDFDSETCQELFVQCLWRVPSTQPLAHWPGKSRLNYTFHNAVIDMYCQALNTPKNRIAFCEDVLQRMPNNHLLLQRLVLIQLEEEGPQAALGTLNTHLGPQVMCPTLWRMAISIAYKEKDFNEVRRLYHRAVQVVPYTRCLWIDLVKLETPEKEKTNAVVEKCQELGILISEEEAEVPSMSLAMQSTTVPDRIILA